MKTMKNLVKSMFMNILAAGIIAMAFTACTDDFEDAAYAPEDPAAEEAQLLRQPPHGHLAQPKPAPLHPQGHGRAAGQRPLRRECGARHTGRGNRREEGAAADRHLRERRPRCPLAAPSLPARFPPAASRLAPFRAVRPPEPASRPLPPAVPRLPPSSSFPPSTTNRPAPGAICRILPPLSQELRKKVAHPASPLRKNPVSLHCQKNNNPS